MASISLLACRYSKFPLPNHGAVITRLPSKTRPTQRYFSPPNRVVLSRQTQAWSSSRMIPSRESCLPIHTKKSLVRAFSRRGALQNVRYVSTHPVRLDESRSSPDTPTSPTSILRRLSPIKTAHENIYTLPNILTFSRLLAAPAVGYFILTSQPWAALSLFFYAGVTDAVDGYLARRFNSQTVVGTVIDPMADKILMTIAVVSLGIQGAIPVWLAVIILGRDVALSISAIYFRWISLPPPKTMARYWDFSLPSAEVHPTEVSKINTLLQLLLVGNAMVLPVLPTALLDVWNLQGVFEGWQLLVAGTTIWSGLSYIWSKDAVKILSQDEITRRMQQRANEVDDQDPGQQKS